MLQEINKDDTSLIFKSVRFLKLRYSSKYFAPIYRDQYLRGTPTLRPENSVKSGTYFGYLGDWLSALNKQAFT